MRLITIIFLICSFITSEAQNINIQGTILDSGTQEPLPGVSILIFQSATTIGGISNREGKFNLNHIDQVDSVKFSAIGYRSLILKSAQMIGQVKLVISLEREELMLKEVTVHPIGVMEIIHRAIEKIHSSIPSNAFENTAFYREIIQDSQQYFSAAEAIFKVQYFPQKRFSKMIMIKGRSKEDVTYSRLFEDFHPGGGPEAAVNLSFVISQPDFLNENKIKDFIYKKEPSVSFEGRRLYVISFDQKPGIHESLESGNFFIDAEDYNVLKFEAGNSVAGTPYIKSLKGTDKIFAGLLNIEFSVKGWKRMAVYRKSADKIYLDFASLEYRIDYKQVKKNIDLKLDIQTEWMTSGIRNEIQNEIEKSQEWKRKDLVSNLPSDFDSAFWGAENILSETKENREMMEAISKKNNEPDETDSLAEWKYFNKDFFLAFNKGDSLNMIVLKKCNWENAETGGMLYKMTEGNFDIELKLSVSKRTGKSQTPDNGFQQAGIIVRSPETGTENNLIFSMGTGGNEKPKYFLKTTTLGKTRTMVEKTEEFEGRLKIERRGGYFSIFRKSNADGSWVKVNAYDLDWAKGNLQVGFSVMARFAGDGPKQHPDIRAIFSDIHFIHLD
ncbi:MAG TPA: carboxypeptidase-like regulatory domain-containing protein [Puia sp.]|nr:carboxypeptidase-like regulatory domain-containing protein [Puia sp.]